MFDEICYHFFTQFPYDVSKKAKNCFQYMSIIEIIETFSSCQENRISLVTMLDLLSTIETIFGQSSDMVGGGGGLLSQGRV